MEILKAALRFRVKRERRSYRAAHRVADKAVPRFVSVLLTETRNTRNRINIARLMRAVASGNVSEIESTLLLPSLDEGLRRQYRRQIQQVLVAGGNASVVLQPKPLAGVFGRFDGVNPRAVEWARAKSATLVQQVSETFKETVRTVIAEGIDEGITVRETARRLREDLGLTRSQSQSVRNFRRRLVEQGVPRETVQARTGRFASKVLRRRSLNIARTETIDAAFQGRQELWLQARDRGLIDEQTVRRRWIVTPDDRLDRRICLPMPGLPENQNVGLQELFTTGDGRQVLGPTAHPQCRCDVVLHIPKPGIRAVV